MKHIHLPTVIILGVGIFCGSVASFDMANAIQIYWSGFFAILILTYFLVCACLGKYKAVMFPKDRIMKTLVREGFIIRIKKDLYVISSMDTDYTIPLRQKGVHAVTIVAYDLQFYYCAYGNNGVVKIPHGEIGKYPIYVTTGLK